MNDQKLEDKFRPRSISSEFKELFTFACKATKYQNINVNASSEEYVREFYKWIKPKDARNDKTFIGLIEAVTGNTYSTFEKWQSNGSPEKEDKASLCFGASSQFHNTHIEEHFAKFLHFWNAFREVNPVKSDILAKPDFLEYKIESKNLLEKYRLIPTECLTKRHSIEQYPFAAQLQRHFPSQGFEHKAKFDDIKYFIDTNPSGYVMIEDATGTDKSRLAAYTAKTLYDTGQYQCIWHFNEMGSGHNRSADLLHTIFSQLKDMYPSLEGDCFAHEYERVLNSDIGYAVFYKTIFDQLVCDEKFLSGKLVILVDALDEVSQSDPSRQESINALFLPQSLIGNAFIVVTSKSFERETYIGNKLEINLSEIDTCHKNEQIITKSQFRIERVEGEEKWLDPYNHKALPLVGREKEFELLDKFIQNGGQFKIWAIVGPSGAGKTRLVSQWAYESSELEGWDRRFLHKEDRAELEIWLNWLPDKPTLLMIDYMYGFDDVVLKLMNHRLKPNTPKIRLLLIDHVFSEPLHSDKRWGFSGDGSSLNRNEDYFFDLKPLDLRQTQDQEIIIKSIIAHRAGIDKRNDQVDEANTYLQNTHGAYHPLFAALVGDAIKSGQDFKVWNRRELIDYYLSGDDRLPWKHEGNTGRWASHFIAAATVRHRMSYRDLITATGNCTFTPEHFFDVKDICQKVISDDNDVSLAPFEPDILGESFFLKFLQFLENSPTYQKEFREIFMAGNEDTQIEDATEFISFIQRLTQNLFNDDQSQKETRALWDSLFDFMSPTDFRGAEPIQWGVTAGLIGIVDAIQDQFPENKIVTLLNKIDSSVLYQVKNEGFLTESVLHSMLYFELAHKYLEIPPKLSDEMLTLFDRYRVNNVDGETPLMTASYAGFNKMIHALIAHEMDVEATLTSGQNALMVASLMGNTEAAQYLLNITKTSINTADNKGCTALMWASGNGHAEMTKLLIDKGAKIDVADNQGRTALMRAIDRNHVELVRLLLDKEANIEAVDKEGHTALMWASGNGHAEMTKLLIDKGAKIDVADNQGRTALMLSSFSGHTDVVRVLLDNGADIDATDKESCTALMWASTYDHLETVRLLLDKQANTQAVDKKGQTALMWVSTNGNADMVRLLLNKEVNIDATENKGRTALMLSSFSGHTDVVRVFLDNGADIDAADNESCTALMWASTNDHIETVRLLLDKEANTEAVDKEGHTALMWASIEGHSEIARLLLGKGSRIDVADNADRTALMGASIKGYVELVKLLLEKEANFEVADKEGHTALMWASIEGHTEIVRLLLDKGAKIDVADQEDRTALIWASVNGHIETVRLLLSRKANIHAIDKLNSTALVYASFCDHAEIVKLLLDKKAQIDATNIGNDFTPLILASVNDHIDTVRQLLDRGAYIDAADNEGRTSLMWATINGHIKTIELLLDEGADIQASDEENRTALIFACGNGHIETARLLLDKGADIHAVDKDNFSALMQASYNGYIDIVEMLLDKGVNVNTVDIDGCTPLIWACINNHIEVIKLLLKRQAQIDVVDHRGQTALSIMKASGNREILQLLIEHDAKN